MVRLLKHRRVSKDVLNQRMNPLVGVVRDVERFVPKGFDLVHRQTEVLLVGIGDVDTVDCF